VKGLSIRQPWAHLIAHGPKRIENRRWYCSYRGEIAIHAAKGCSRGEHVQAVEFVVSCSLGAMIPRYGAMPLGAIVGVATVVDCLRPGYRVIERYNPAAASIDWWDYDQYGIVLDNVRALREPVPCAGMLGLWTVPEDIERQVREQLR